MATNQLPTLTEHISCAEANYVLSLSYDEFFNIFPKEKTEDIAKSRNYYFMIRKYLYAHIANKFQGIEIAYKFSGKQTKGRIYGQHQSGMCLQRMHKSLRCFLTKEIYHDYDIKNAHPTILLALCKKHKIECPNHEYYVNNRSEVLKKNAVDKTEMLSKLNQDLPKNGKTAYIKQLFKEWIEIKKQLYDIYYDDYHIDGDNSKNPISSIINRLFCEEERQLLIKATCGVSYDVNMFDGFLSREKYNIKDNELYGVPIIWEEKDIVSDVVVPMDYEIPENDGDTYKIMKQEFERQWAKVTYLSGFVRIDINGNVIQYTKEQMKVMYEDMYFLKTDPNTLKTVKMPFIETWLKDDSKRCFNSLGCYPDPTKCPDDVLNTWTPYVVEKMQLHEYDEKAIELFKNHVSVLCNHEEPVTEFILKVIAHYFQYPDGKSLFPSFVGQEGNGKSILFEGLTIMMGKEKVFFTTDPLRDFLGEFNGDLAGKKLVVMNELNPSELGRAEKKFKSLITDIPLHINPKKEKRYDTQSYHVFVGMLNPRNEGDGVISKEGDRRNVVIRCSDEKVGDTKYFNELWKIFENENAMASLYKYFMEMKDVPFRFTPDMIPKTEYQENIKQAHRSYLDLFLESRCIETDVSSIEQTGKQVLDSYLNWTKINNIKEPFEMNVIKLGLRLSNIREISKKHTKRGVIYRIDLDALRKRFMVGCMVKLENEYDSDASCESDPCGP